jgi:hypothetical protein
VLHVPSSWIISAKPCSTPGRSSQQANGPELLDEDTDEEDTDEEDTDEEDTDEDDDDDDDDELLDELDDEQHPQQGYTTVFVEHNLVMPGKMILPSLYTRYHFWPYSGGGHGSEPTTRTGNIPDSACR